MIRNSRELGDNLKLIINRLSKNQNLVKLLYYTDKDPLGHEDLKQETIDNCVINKLIKYIPRIGPKETANSLITLRVTKGVPDEENNEFRIVNISIEIFVPLTQWEIKNVNLRPFAIMGEIENSLKGKSINGLGKMKYLGFDLNFLTEEISCYELNFRLETYE